MDYLTYSKRLEYLLNLIERGKLSSPCDLEAKFDCTERTVRKMINDLRVQGHNIKYSRKNFKYILLE
jgi:predicted DNA-binding transcriptional regulator YafY